MIEKDKEYYNKKIGELYAVIENQEKIIRDLQEEKIKLENLLDTILTYHLFSDTCPLEFGFEKDSLQDKAQNVFYEDDGEYCEKNCDDCYKKCWLKFFKKIMELKGEDNE